MLYRIMLTLAFVMVLTAQSCATSGDAGGEDESDNNSVESKAEGGY